MSDPTYLKNFKALVKRSVEDRREVVAIETELYSNRSDRARAVLLASFVEMSLEALLRKQTRPSFNAQDYKRLFDFNGAAGSFSAKTVVAYSFN